MTRQSLKGFLLILDTVEGRGRRLIPLPMLVDQLERLLPGLLNAAWTIRRGADGYGEFIGQIVARLEAEDSISVLGSDIMNAIRTGEEWFEDVFIHVSSYGIEFGVHDSTALFFRGRHEDMLAVAHCFSDVRQPG